MLPVESTLTVFAIAENGVNVPGEESVIERKDFMDRLSLRVPGLGIFMALVSALCFATAGFAIEKVIHVDPSLAVIYRSFAQLIVYGLIGIWQEMNLVGVPGERIFIFGRCLGGFFSFSLGYYAFRYMSFADVNTICMSAPVYVAPFAAIFLKEACGLFQTLVIAITIIGVFLITRPTFLFGTVEGANFTSQEQTIGAILSVLCALSITLSVICLRKIPKTPATVVIIWFSLYSIVFGVVVICILKFGCGVFIGLPLSPRDYLFIALNAVCGVLGQCFFVWSLKLEEAGIVTLVRTSDIVLAFIYQVAFLQQKIIWTSIVGAVIVCSTVGLTCIRKIYQVKPEMFACFTKKTHKRIN